MAVNRNKYPETNADATGLKAPNPNAPASTPKPVSAPGFTGSSHGVNVLTDPQQDIKNQMNQNSIAWHSADDAEKARLHEENKKLAGQLGGTVGFNPNTGYWGGDVGGLSGGSGNYGNGFSYVNAPSYANRYDAAINELLQGIMNRDPFSYDYNNDPLYAQYKEAYTREGDRAMKDTLGQVSARTGGLASSYATSAATQANDYYMQQLGDKIPELQQLAYSMYQDEGDRQRQNMNLLMALEQGDYAKYQDLLNQYNTDRDFNYGMYSDDWNRNYQVGRDTIEDSRYDQEWEYGVGRDAKTDAVSMIENMIANGVPISSIDPALIEASGISSGMWGSLGTAVTQQAAKASRSSGSSGGGSKSADVSDGGYGDYTELFEAMAADGVTSSQQAQNWMVRNGVSYKAFGQSASSVGTEFAAWAESRAESDAAAAEAEANEGALYQSDADHVWIEGLNVLMTWTELENAVDSGEVIEFKDQKTGKWRYRGA